MKIGIVTWFKSGNFGTNLQAIALYKYLEKHHDCYFINYFNYKSLASPDKKIYYFYQIKLLVKLVLKPFLNLRLLFTSGNFVKGCKILNFFKDYKEINIYSRRQLLKIDSFDVFVTGSDQIWNPYHTIDFNMLNFAEGKKRIAYSSSIGVNNIPDEKKSMYFYNLSKFTFISVRENIAANILKILLNRDDIMTVVDPVFLLNCNEWKSLIELKKKTVDTPYIFCYFVGNNDRYAEEVKEISLATNIKKIIYIPAVENLYFKCEGLCIKDAGLCEFVNYIANAELICTDSFHATSFSLIFQKEFIEFKRFADEDVISQNSRLYDMLQHYQLENRFYHKNFCFDDIDYSSVNSRLNHDIVFSKKYLYNALLENE